MKNPNNGNDIRFPGGAEADRMAKKHRALAEAWDDHEHITMLYYFGTNHKGKPNSLMTIAKLYGVSFATIKAIIETSRKEQEKEDS